MGIYQLSGILLRATDVLQIVTLVVGVALDML